MAASTASQQTHASREFVVEGAFVSNRSSPVRWIISHLLRDKFFLLAFVIGSIVPAALSSYVLLLTGQAFDDVLNNRGARLAFFAGLILLLVVIRGVVELFTGLSIEVLSSRLKRNAREELYVSLLGKSQTFHNRQQVGDLMARTTGDTSQLGMMMSPGVDLIINSSLMIIIPVIFIALINWQLLLGPMIFVLGFLVTLRIYVRMLEPVAHRLRAANGRLSAGLNEAITGIEVVKSAAQEHQEQGKFNGNATAYKDAYVRQGEIQSIYLPPLVLAFATAIAFLQGIILVHQGTISIGELVAVMGLMRMLDLASHLSVFTIALVQFGVAGAQRILNILNEVTELDENVGGHDARIEGEIVFDHVSFGYGEQRVLKDVSFTVEPGQTIAIVGQTGSGKSTVTRLVNRIYDVDSGRITIDGVDTKDWNLDRLRSQISTIEQDVFLFSRSIRENIAFSRAGDATDEEVERAARDAQAHDFIMSFKDGYDTIIGERGVTLSGGQRQRLAIARALLTDPRILILDDSTSAIDSATEDEIQRAILRLQQGRTTLLITHRLSQIRWADSVLVMANGEVVDQGNHAELMQRCDLYRRIFSHYESMPSEPTAAAAAAGNGA